MYMRPLLYWDVMQQDRMVVDNGQFGTIIGPMFENRAVQFLLDLLDP